MARKPHQAGTLAKSVVGYKPKIQIESKSLSTKKGSRFTPTPFLFLGGIWGSNPRPPEPQSGALTN